MRKIPFFLFILILVSCIKTGSTDLQYLVHLTITQTYTEINGTKTFDVVVFDQAYAAPSSGNWKTDQFTTSPKIIGEYKSTSFRVDYIVDWDINVTAVKAYWKVSDYYKGTIDWIKELPLQDKKSPFKISELVQLAPNTSYTTEQGVVDI
ncbi:MAG: hypothetical protein ABSF32_01835 [Ignavibacteria bacterium]|jgi:hypothetical protein